MFKLSLRDLFWLVLVVAIGCAWWVQSGASARRYAELARECQDWKDRAEWVSTTWAMQGGPRHDWGEASRKVYHVKEGLKGSP